VDVPGQQDRPRRAALEPLRPAARHTARVQTIDEYIASCPEAVRPVLEEIRRRAHAVVPGSGETIRYGMPTITLDRSSLVHFAAWKRHIALYPAPEPSDDPAFEQALAPHRGDRGTLRFPLAEPLPVDLVTDVVRRLAGART
jgi:uncharacterized protein YdhG (YjbR/CyaY superfamily)